jgi:nucleotide-binding universal stress UspA family protein
MELDPTGSAPSWTARRSARGDLHWPFGTAQGPPDASLGDRPILLAFDGGVESLAAAGFTNALVARRHSDVHVVAVLDTSPVPMPFPLDRLLGMADERDGGPLHREQANDVRQQLATLAGHPIDWPVAIALGRPSEVILQRAVHSGCGLIVMGLRQHGHLDRIVNDETALAVMRGAPVPVLGVSQRTQGLPKRALVAMDFTQASVRAAMAAAHLMDANAAMTLAFVESRLDVALEGDDVVHALGIEQALTELEGMLSTPSLSVDRVILHHVKARAPATTLLEYADANGIDLIAAGSARHGRLDRILLGSTSAELVRAGACSTLIVPPTRDS